MTVIFLSGDSANAVAIQLAVVPESKKIVLLEDMSDKQ